jgi:hypothetical protein
MTIRPFPDAGRQSRRNRACRFVVLGCGHTGTTLISGILHINGYGSFNVSRLFENTRLNDLNRRLLDGSEVDDAEIGDFIMEVERRTGGNWSLKDPRLSETISRFYPHIPQPAKIILNYRHPGTTVRSLIKEKELEGYAGLEAQVRSAEDEWLRRNRGALVFLDYENHSPTLILDYDDLVERRLDETVCRFVGRPLDMSFIEPKKRHSTPMPVRKELLDLYEELDARCLSSQREVLRTTRPVRVKVALRPTLRTRAHVQANRIVNGLRWRRARVDGFVKARCGIDGRSR